MFFFLFIDLTQDPIQVKKLWKSYKILNTPIQPPFTWLHLRTPISSQSIIFTFHYGFKIKFHLEAEKILIVKGETRKNMIKPHGNRETYWRRIEVYETLLVPDGGLQWLAAMVAKKLGRDFWELLFGLEDVNLIYWMRLI